MYRIRVFYGSKIVTEESLEVATHEQACRLARYVACTLAKEYIPPWMFAEKRVSYVVVEPRFVVVA